MRTLRPPQPPRPPGQLLLINPNTSSATTERLVQTLSPRLPGDVRLLARTARLGARYIACEASHAMAGAAVLETWAAYLAEHGAGHGAESVGDGMAAGPAARAADDRAAAPAAAAPLLGVLIGCFGDPGLFALRESSACPVTGLAEASFIEAARHGPFAVVTGGERWKPMLRRLAENLGHGEALHHIETVAATGAELQRDPARAQHVLAEACAAAARPGVRAIVVGGAGLAGLAAVLQPQVSLPLIDSALAGLTVLLEGRAPAPARAHDGFVADWSEVPPAMARLARGR